MHALSRLSPIFLLFVLVFVVLTLREIYTSAQLAELREENARLRSALAPCMPTINKPPGKGKLKAIFVLGTEGVGHHMIMPAIARVSCVENSFSDLENAIFLVYETYIPIHNFKRMEDQMHLCLNRLYRNALQNNKTHAAVLYTPLSFPYYRPEDPLRRADILHLTEAIERAGFDVKYVVMIRDFIRAINSVFRRGFSFTERFCHNMQLTTKEIEHSNIRFRSLGCDALIPMARSQEDNIMYINSVLRILDPSYYYILDYDDILTAPEREIPGLARFLELPEADLLEAFKAVAVPGVREKPLMLKPEEVEFLKEKIFFDAKKPLYMPAMKHFPARK